jgi:hypothetical protein
METTTSFCALGPQLLYFSTDFKNKICFGSTILQAIHFHLFDDFNLLNGKNIQDGVFQIFYTFLKALESPIVNY